MKPATGKTCPDCNSVFTCGTEQGNQACWCLALPAIMPPGLWDDCRCQSCLARVIAARIESSIQENSHAQMLEMACRFRHQDGLLEHIDYTLENGNHVFSRWYHLKRGSCCGNGCRNCPYPEA